MGGFRTETSYPSAILIPRLPGHGCFESAKLLDTLVLLYDRILWQSPPNQLLVPEALRHYPDLAKYGVDEGFPERFVEYVRQGIIIGITDHPGLYSMPYESNQEYEWASRVRYSGIPPLEWQRDEDLLSGLEAAAALLARTEGHALAAARIENSEILLPLMLCRGLVKATEARDIFVADSTEDIQWKIWHNFIAASSGTLGARPLLGTEEMISPDFSPAPRDEGFLASLK